jgi:hypothetical protein
VNERGRIHSDERDKRAEVEQLRVPLKGQQEGTQQGHGAQQQHVLAHDSRLGTYYPEDPFRQGPSRVLS